MLVVWWIPKATNTHLEYVISIAFPLEQWLQKRGSILRYTYIACRVYIYIYIYIYISLSIHRCYPLYLGRTFLWRVILLKERTAMNKNHRP
jgi:hypothetical protein